jgi:hypothetical protein
MLMDYTTANLSVMDQRLFPTSVVEGHFPMMILLPQDATYDQLACD